MDMSFHQTRHNQSALRVENGRIDRQTGTNSHDPAGLDRDVDHPLLPGDAGVPDQPVLHRRATRAASRRMISNVATMITSDTPVVAAPNAYSTGEVTFVVMP